MAKKCFGFCFLIFFFECLTDLKWLIMVVVLVMIFSIVGAGIVKEKK